MAKQNEIRITNVPKDIKEDLENIADNIGISLVTLLKPKLREIRDSYSEKMRKPRPKD
jgi:hypothetical protein